MGCNTCCRKLFQSLSLFHEQQQRKNQLQICNLIPSRCLLLVFFLVLMACSCSLMDVLQTWLIQLFFCLLPAFRFVGLVRSKTPKVTMYTERAKCMLMENCPAPDFEAVFYDGRLNKPGLVFKEVKLYAAFHTLFLLSFFSYSLAQLTIESIILVQNIVLSADRGVKILFIKRNSFHIMTFCLIL